MAHNRTHATPRPPSARPARHKAALAPPHRSKASQSKASQRRNRGLRRLLVPEAELEKHQGDLDKLGLTVLPVVVNDPAAVRAEMRRFGLRTPFLTDPGGQVARAYDAVGSASAMHANLPGHTFILIDPTGRITWRGEYPSMFVPTSQLLDSLQAALTPTATTAHPR